MKVKVCFETEISADLPEPQSSLDTLVMAGITLAVVKNLSIIVLSDQ